MGLAAANYVVSARCRYGGAELHTVAAYVGGVVAQEIIKLITSQYVPIANTLIFNGVTCTVESLVV